MKVKQATLRRVCVIPHQFRNAHHSRYALATKFGGNQYQTYEARINIQGACALLEGIEKCEQNEPVFRQSFRRHFFNLSS